MRNPGRPPSKGHSAPPCNREDDLSPSPSPPPPPTPTPLSSPRTLNHKAEGHDESGTTCGTGRGFVNTLHSNSLNRTDSLPFPPRKLSSESYGCYRSQVRARNKFHFDYPSEHHEGAQNENDANYGIGGCLEPNLGDHYGPTTITETNFSGTIHNYVQDQNDEEHDQIEMTRSPPHSLRWRKLTTYDGRIKSEGRTNLQQPPPSECRSNSSGKRENQRNEDLCALCSPTSLNETKKRSGNQKLRTMETGNSYSEVLRTLSYAHSRPSRSMNFKQLPDVDSAKPNIKAPWSHIRDGRRIRRSRSLPSLVPVLSLAFDDESDRFSERGKEDVSEEENKHVNKTADNDRWGFGGTGSQQMMRMRVALHSGPQGMLGNVNLIRFLGCVDITRKSTLEDVRRLILEELDDVPANFVFSEPLKDDRLIEGNDQDSNRIINSRMENSILIPVGRKQERKRRAYKYLPLLLLISIPSADAHVNAANTSSANCSAVSSPLNFSSGNASVVNWKSSASAGDDEIKSCFLQPEMSPTIPTETHNMTTIHCSNETSAPTISVMFACPLAYIGADNKLGAMPLVDHEAERDLMCRSLEEAKRAVHLEFGFATTDHLRSVVTRGCRVMHYSGHANPNLVSFEDGFGGVHFVHVQQLKSLFAAGGQSGKPLLCVVSACSSRAAGQAFVDAGVPHVVAVEQEVEVLDRAAAVFTRSFYLALVQGKSVSASFDIATEAVKASPHSKTSEAAKFLLLPEVSNAKDCRHDRCLFTKLPRLAWKRPRPIPPCDLEALPAVPEGFVGRNVSLYHVINQILRHRLVALVAPSGYGKTAVGIAAAHYLSERRYFRDGVFYIERTDHGQHRAPLSNSSLVLELCRQLRRRGATLQDDSNRSLEQSIVSVLQGLQCLVVIDDPDVQSSSLRAFITRILRHASGLKVLFTARQGLSENCPLFGVSERLCELPPLDRRSAAKLLLKRSPRIVEPTELDGVKTKENLISALAAHPALVPIPGHIVKVALMLRFHDLQYVLDRVDQGSHTMGKILKKQNFNYGYK